MIKNFDGVRLLEEAKLIAGASKNSDVLAEALKFYISKKSPELRHEHRQQKQEKQPRGATATSESQPTKPNINTTRYIPVMLRDKRLIKANRQCSFVGVDGKRCTERQHLEIDHIRPYSLGGTHQESNLQVLCRSHNRLLAERVFGRERIESYTVKKHPI